MKRFKWITAAALLAGMVIVGAAPAKASLVLTITQGGSSTSASMDTTTGAITPGVTVGTVSGPGFVSIINPVSGLKTLSFAGTVGSVFFDLSTAATSNTPGSPTMAMLSIGSTTISNLTGSSQSFTIATTATDYTVPSGPALVEISNSGTLTSGGIAGTFDGSADGIVLGPIAFAATGVAQSLANNPPGSVGLLPASYPMTATLTSTLDGNSSTATLGGTVVVTAVPEPSTVATALAGVALVGLGALRRKFRNPA